MEQALTALYGEDQVAAVITLKVDTKEADRIATEIGRLYDDLMGLATTQPGGQNALSVGAGQAWRAEKGSP